MNMYLERSHEILTNIMQTTGIMNKKQNYRKIYKLIAITAILNLFILTTQAQDSLVVKGIVVDGADKPVENVSVGVEGSYDLPVVTDSNGQFILKTGSGDVWLNIAPSSDFKSKRIFLNNQTQLKVFLTDEDLDAGDDIIYALNQNRLRRNLATSFTELNVEDINEAPVMTVDQYLQGRIPGMHVINHSGQPGSAAVTYLRGVHSINGSNEPLYVVDGVPVIEKGIFGTIISGYEYNPLLGINTLDISQATVFKDPALAAAYGSKASNGLVVIETLDPSATETSIDLDLRRGYSLAPSNFIPQLDANQHKTLINEVLFSSGLEEEKIRVDYPQLFYQPTDEQFINYNHNTNWQELIFSDAAFTNFNIKVKGGDEIARYGLSFGYFDADGILKNTSYKGYNIRFRGLLNIFTWLKMNSGVSLNYSNSFLKESGKVPQASPIIASLAKSPLLNPYQYDPDGNELSLLAEVDELGVSNPLAIIDNSEASNNNFTSALAMGFDATINKDLHLNSNFGVNYSILREQAFLPNLGMELYYNDEAINVAEVSNNSLIAFFNNTALNYKKDFGLHKVVSSTGFNLQTNAFQYDWALTKNSPENDQYRRLQDGTPNLRDIGGQNRTWNWLSLYESLSYSYKDKYLALGSVSLDASSRVGDNALNTQKIGGVPFGLFYSAGVAWRLSNEAFLINRSNLEELKIRLTYGRTGNDDIGEANATNYYEAINYRETVGLIPATAYNDKLTYETVSQLNAGVDLALWGNRFRTSVDAYLSQTDNMLIYTPLAAYFGYKFRPENGGTMSNKGIDFSLFYRIIDARNFKWDIQASYSYVNNKITEIKGDKLITEIGEAEIINMPGEKANSFYGYEFLGVYATTADAEAMGLVNNKLIPYKAGDAIYADISGPDGVPDSIINDFDKKVLGSALPDQWGGISNTISFKRWSLSALVQFTSGNEIYNYIRYKNESMTGLENQSTRTLNRWQYEGQKTMVPRADYEDQIGNAAFSSRWIEDGSYLRLKSLSLSYTIPKEFLTFKNAKVYISATNLFTLTKYLGYDPEFSYSTANITQGIDYGITPQARQFIFGFKLGL